MHNLLLRHQLFRKFFFLIILLVGLYLSAGIFTQFWRLRQINSFQSCAQAGFPVLQIFPPICKTSDGRTFIKNVTEVVSPTPTNSLGTSGIQGQVVLGPSCPNVQPGTNVNCEDKPYKASLVVKDKNGNSEITHFTTDNNGIFRLNLPYGSYLLEDSHANGYPFLKPIYFTVGKGTYSTLQVVYDTGIR